jgi:hypothetical protein
MHAAMLGAHPRPFYSYAITSPTANLNLFNLAGNPSSAGNFTFTISSDVYEASSAFGYAMRTGGFPAGSTITLIIASGGVYGAQGGGGAGGSFGPGSDGGGGTNCLLMDDDLILIASGVIFSGGNGGRGGDAAHSENMLIWADGGGGGNGQGYIVGAGVVGPDAGSPGSTNGSVVGASGGMGDVCGDGVAINKQGHTLTFTTGNDAAHVKGSII